MANWWKIPNKAIEEFLERDDGTSQKEHEIAVPVPSPLVIEEELSEVVSESSSFDLSGSEDSGDDEDSLTTTESEEDEDSISVFVGEPPSVIIIAVMISAYQSDDDGLPPTSTISVLQQLFADLDDDFDAENELMETRTVVSALTGVLTA